MLSNTVASRHMWPFKLKLKKIKNSAPQSHLPHFERSIATYGQWLPYWIASKVLLDSILNDRVTCVLSPQLPAFCTCLLMAA